MKRRFLSCLLTATMLLSVSAPTAVAASNPWDFKNVGYDDIESLVEDCLDFSDSTVDMLQSTYNGLKTYAATLSAQRDAAAPGSAEYISLDGQLTAVEANLKGIGVTIGLLEQSMNGKDTPEESTVVAEDTLYITYNSLRDQLSELHREQGVFSETLNSLQQQHDAGYLSDLQLEQTQAQGNSIQSGVQTIQVQLNGVKRSFNTLLGRDYNQALDLHSLPFSRLDDIKDMKFSDDLDTALSNYSGDLSGSGYENDDYDETRGSFAAQFRKLYDTVNSKNDLLGTEEKNLEVEQKSFAASQKQYDAGLISRLALVGAQDGLDTETAKVKAARTDLFSAYAQYRWAMDYGIVSES